MSYAETRELICQALDACGIDSENIRFHKDDVPSAFPAAMGVLQGEKGVNGTSKRYTSIEHDIGVFLIADVNDSDDPDSAVLALSERFREQYRKHVGRDIPQIEYYAARADSGRRVRIAKIFTVTP